MKYNKRLLLILGISAVLLVGSILTFTSCSKKPSEDTNTSVNGDSENNNESNDNDQNISSEEDDKKEDDNKENDTTTDDKNDEADGSQDNNVNSDNNTQDKENTNTDNKDDSSSGNNQSSNNNNNNSNSGNTAPDKGENNTDTSLANMEINKEGIYAIDNHYFKSIYPLDEKSVLKAANYINSIQETYLTENNKVFYAIIPDKTYYDKSSSYDKLDYDKMITILNENIKNMEYIKLKDLLSLDDYYQSDNHWKQEKIIDIANRIGEKLNFKINATSFEKKSYNGLKGMYTKYVTNTKFKEELQYLTNNHISSATVDNYQNKKFTSVYDTNRLSTDISYDVFLSGATPFLTITNSSANSDKELVIFRDSYTSSLAPLLISEYSKITLIDTRYMASTLIKDFIEFDNQDVLFLYSSAVINNSTMLK